MKEKTIWITLSIIIAILALGIAYAAITTQTLNVVGNVIAETSDSNFRVEIIDVSKQDLMSTAGNIESSIMATAQTAVMTVSGLNTRGQVVTARVAVKNCSADIDAVVTSEAVHTNSTWYKIKNMSEGPQTIKPGETEYILVEITLLDTPATDADVAASADTITITIDADAA